MTQNGFGRFRWIYSGGESLDAPHYGDTPISTKMTHDIGACQKTCLFEEFRDWLCQVTVSGAGSPLLQCRSP